MDSNDSKALSAINLVLAILAEEGPISGLIDQARQEGRSITKTEFNKLFAQDDDARAQLAAAISAAEAEGR